MKSKTLIAITRMLFFTLLIALLTALLLNRYNDYRKIFEISVSDTSGNPVEGVTITADSPNFELINARTDTLGNFRFSTVLPTGSAFKLSFKKNGHIIHSRSITVNRSDETIITPLEITAYTPFVFGKTEGSVSSVYWPAGIIDCGYSGIAASPDGKYLYYSINSRSDTVRDNVIMKIELTPDKGTVPGKAIIFAGDESSYGVTDGIGKNANFGQLGPIKISPDGETLYAADINCIRIIDTSTAEVKTVSLKNHDRRGDAAETNSLFDDCIQASALSADGKTLYLTDGYCIKRADTKTWNVDTIAGKTNPDDRESAYYCEKEKYNDGNGTEARFNRIRGLVTTGDSTTLYAADFYNHKIRKIIVGKTQALTKVQTICKSQSFDFNRIYYPDLLLSQDNTKLYLADMEKHRIAEIALGSQKADTFVNCGKNETRDGFVRPMNLKVPIAMSWSADYKTIYFKDIVKNIKAVNTVTKSVNTVLCSTVDHHYRADTISAMAAANDGKKLYVSVTRKNSIFEFGTDSGIFSPIAGSGKREINDGTGKSASFYFPKKIVLSPDGKMLYIADADPNEVVFTARIRVVNLVDRSVTTLINTGDSLHSMAISPDGRYLYTGSLDYSNHRNYQVIKKIDITAQTVVTLAGNIRGHADGVGPKAKMGMVSALAVSPDGAYIFFTDTGNGRSVGSFSSIRRLELSTNKVTTLAAGGLSDKVNAIAVYPDNTLLAFSDNKAIKIMSLKTFEVRTIAGKENETGFVDAAGAEARFDDTVDLAFCDGGSRLFVLDKYGAIRTIAAIYSKRKWIK